MKKVIAGLMAVAIVFGTTAVPEVAQSVFNSTAIQASAATDAWGREYLVYGDLKYQVKSDNTITIIGFDINKSTVEIPDQIDGKPVTKIGDNAFYDASRIKTIKIPDSVTSIGDNAFYYAKALESVVLPNSLIEIGNNAFDTCESLKSVTLPSSLKTIGEYAFSYSGLESIDVPNGVTTIKRNAFYNCSSLVSAKLPSSVQTLGQQVFAFCSKLENVTLPDSLKSIPDRTFFKADSLKNVTIPANVTSIGKYAFYYCTSLQDVTIPEKVQTIDESAFEGCSSLKTVDISEGVTTLGKYVFHNCTSLTSFIIPKSVASIGDFCFADDTKLKVYVYRNSYGATYALKNNLNFTYVSIADVTGFKAWTPENNSVVLTWNAVDGAEGYIVYKYDTSKKTWVRLSKTTTTDTTYTASGLSSSETNKFAVKAYKTVKGNEVVSVNFPTVAVDVNVASVTGFKVSATAETTVKLTWDKVSGAQGYIVYRYDNTKKTWVRIAKSSTDSNVYTASKLSAGTAYKFAVKAYKTVDGKEQTSTTFPQVLVMTKLQTVTGFKAASKTGTTVTLTWNKVNNAKGYVVYKYDTSKKTWVRLAKSSTNSTTYTASKLSSLTTYKFAVRAYNTLNDTEVLSTSFPQLSVQTNLADVTGAKGVADSSSRVVLSWNKVDKADGYVIYQYITSKKTYVRLGKVSKLNTGVSKLASGTTYKFAVRAYKTVNGKEVLSAKYPVITVSTKPATVDFKLTAGSGKATVNWSKVNGATGYIVYYKTSANGSWQRLTSTTGTSYTKTGLTKGKTYYFTVKAYRTVDGTTYNAAYSTKSVTVK